MSTATLPVRTESSTGKVSYSFPKIADLETAMTPEDQEYVTKAQAFIKEYGYGEVSRLNLMLVLMQVKARFPEHLKNAVPHMTIRTFNAWKAEGRRVRKGESAMQCTTMVRSKALDDKGEDTLEGYLFPRTAHVFGIWQTDLVA